MEYTLSRERCAVCETILDASSEQPVDLDLSLPDYCPDIERIVKCRLCPSVTSRSINGNRLEVEGTAVIRLFYLDSKKQTVRLCEHTSPFSCSFELKRTEPDMTACVRLKNEYLNCRAVSPRRLDIHGAFTVLASVYSRGSVEYPGSVEGSDIQQKTHTETVSELRGMSSQQFSVSEVLDFGQGKGIPELLLRSELEVIPAESTAIDDKLMLKGSIILRVLYKTDAESGTEETMSFEIPYSQVIDVPGISAGTENDVSISVMSHEAALRSEYDAASTLMTFDAKLTALVFAYEDKLIELTDDAYSTDYELELVKGNVPLCRLAALCDMTESVKDTISTGENNITRVIDLWCESISSMVSSENGRIIVRGKLNCCILCCDNERTPFCTEKSVDFCFEPEQSEIKGQWSAVPSFHLTSLSYVITGENSVEIRAGLRMRMAVYSNSSCRCIMSASASEDHCRERDTTAALTIYYADEGENLWDIARLYCTSAEAIRLENEMPEDTAQVQGMVLIPM